MVAGMQPWPAAQSKQPTAPASTVQCPSHLKVRHDTWVGGSWCILALRRGQLRCAVPAGRQLRMLAGAQQREKLLQRHLDLVRQRKHAGRAGGLALIAAWAAVALRCRAAGSTAAAGAGAGAAAIGRQRGHCICPAVGREGHSDFGVAC